VLSPSEIREVKLARGLRGYDRAAAQRLLEEVVSSYEATANERDELRTELERLQAELVEFRELERLLRDTLVLAQRSGEEIKAQARLEAEAAIDEAEARARTIVGDAETSSIRLRDEIQRLEEEERDVRTRFAEFLRQALERWEGPRAGVAGERPALIDALAPALSLARAGAPPASGAEPEPGERFDAPAAAEPDREDF
jgi:cell division initiation protein